MPSKRQERLRPNSYRRRAIRDALLRRDGFACRLCGVSMVEEPNNDPRKMSFDHVVRIKDGGRWTLANMRLVCRLCNIRRG